MTGWSLFLLSKIQPSLLQRRELSSTMSLMSKVNQAGAVSFLWHPFAVSEWTQEGLQKQKHSENMYFKFENIVFLHGLAFEF